MKKSYLLFLAVTSACIPSFGATKVEINDVVNVSDNLKGDVFAIVEKEVYLTVYSNPDNKPEGALVIQDSYDISDGYIYKPYAIKAKGFEKCDGLTSVKINGNITTIPSDGFSECSKLQSVTEAKPGSIQLIGNDAFSYTKALNEVSFPGCQTINSYAFRNSGVKKVNLPEIQYIYAGAFMECSNLSQFTGGEKLKVIDNVAFCNAGSFPSITLGPNLKTIGSMAFAFCTGLKEIVIPENVQTVSNNAFQGLGMERIFILSPNFMEFCDGSKILRNTSLKEVYCSETLLTDIKNYIANGSEENQPQFLAKDAVVKPLSDVVEIKETSTSEYFSAIDKIDDISFLTLFDPTTGNSIPDTGEGYHITGHQVGLRYFVNKVNLLRYVTAVDHPSGIETVDTISNYDSSTVYYDLTGRIVTDPHKGIYIVKKNGKTRKIAL